MFSSQANVRAFVYERPCDMRKQARGLMAIVEGTLQADPRSGDVYLFLNSRMNLLKALFWDNTGICVLAKRLDSGVFRHAWSDCEGTFAVEIDTDKMFALLTGQLQ